MSVPRSCEPQERVNVKVQICEHSFAPDGGYCVYNSLIFFSGRKNRIYKHYTIKSVYRVDFDS